MVEVSMLFNKPISPVSGAIGNGHRSTNAFKRPRVSSHCDEIICRCRRTSASRLWSSCQTLSRPWNVPRTKPASSITRKCLVMACRVIGKPAVNFEIDSGPSPDRRSTRRRRVSSPSAAKTAADSARPGFVLALGSLAKVRLDQLDHDRPAAVVGGECLGTTLERDAIESRLAYGQHDAARCLLEHELDQRGRLLRVIDCLFDGERMPPEREQEFGLDAIDGDLERHRRMLTLRLCHLGVDRAPDEDPAQERAGSERTLELDAEPLFKLADIGQRVPDTGAGCAQQHFLLDAIGHNDSRHTQPPGCLYYSAAPLNATHGLRIIISHVHPERSTCTSRMAITRRLLDRRRVAALLRRRQTPSRFQEGRVLCRA